MRAAFFVEPGRMVVKNASLPVIEKPTDAIIRVVDACVCGSDLWWYRGISPRTPGLTGHEATGVVEEVGDAVTRVKPGDFVVVPFTHGCGYCPACRAGFDANCANTEGGGDGHRRREAGRRRRTSRSPPLRRDRPRPALLEEHRAARRPGFRDDARPRGPPRRRPRRRHRSRTGVHEDLLARRGPGGVRRDGRAPGDQVPSAHRRHLIRPIPAERPAPPRFRPLL